ncbi:hypothetical protein ACS0TY_001837 [Phlomoides rotata]
MSNANNTDTSRAKGKKVVEEHDEAETSAKHQPMEGDATLEKLNISSNELVPIDQINEIVFGTIKDKLEKRTSHPLHTLSRITRGLTT